MAQANPFDRFDKPRVPGGIVVKEADPYKTPQAAAELTARQLANAKAAAGSSYNARNAAADVTQNEANAALAKSKADQVAADAKLATMTPNSKLHGEAYFDAINLPESQRVLARAYAKGDLGSRAGGITTSMLPIIQHAMNYDPTTSATTFPARVKMQSDLAGNQPGTAGGSLRAMEQMVLHGSNVLTSGQALNNYGPGIGAMLNKPIIGIDRLFGNPTVSAYDQEVKNYAPESQKGVAGAAGIGAEREDRAAGYDASLPQASRAAALQADARMALERIGAVNDQYKRLMGHDITDQMSPDARKAYDLIMAGGYGPDGKALYPAPGYKPDSALGGIPGGGGGGGGGSGGGGPSGGLPSGVGIGSGPGGMTIDPARQKIASQVEAMLSSGKPDDQVMAFAKAAGADPDSVQANLDFRRQHPNYKLGYNASALALVPNAKVPSLFDKAVGDGGTGPVANYFMTAGNALSGNTLDNMTADPALARAGLAGANAANPTSSILGELSGTALGAAASEMGAAGLLAKLGMAGKALPALGKAAPLLGDTAYGALSGAGAADDGNRVGGAILGGVLGGGMGVAGRQFVGPLVGNLAGKVGLGSADAPAALSAADKAVLSNAKKVGPDNILSQLAEAKSLNVPMALADTGQQLTSLGGAAVRRSPTASQVASDALYPRARGQIDRLGQAVETNLGPVGNVPQISEDLLSQARTAAGPLYDAAYAAPGAGAIEPQLSSFMQRPSVQNALGRANRIAQEEGRDPTSLGFDLGPNGDTTLTRVPSWQTLDYVKRGLDDTVDAARDSITGRLNTEGNAINGTRLGFLNTVDQANPLYADARRAYGGPMEAKNALIAGQDAFSANPSQLGVDVANAGPADLPQMQLGYRSQLMDAANKLRYSSNPFDGTLGTPAAEQRLTTLYPDSDGVPTLLRARDLEGRLASTTNDVLGNSKTAQRQIADQSFASGALPAAAADVGAMAIGGVPTASIGRALAGGGLRDALTLGFGQKAVQKADDIAPLLFNTDPAQSSDILQRLIANDAAYRGYVNNRPASTIGGIVLSGVGNAGAASLLAPR